MEYSYRFPVVRGLQAGREYYIAMVPLKMLPRLFPNDEGFVLPEYRAQRKLNESRIPVISRYITDNRDSYVFSALAASIDGHFEFHEVENGTGILEVSIDALFLINDGQHRKAAILSSESALSTLQGPTDLNKHAVKTSNSISELYDSRDDVAVATRNVISKIPFLDEYVDKERDIIGKFSSTLFTLNTFYIANKKILRRNLCDDRYEDFLFKFWNGVVINMDPWNEMSKKELSKKDLRESYVATQAIIIQAFGRVGACLWDDEEWDLEKCLTKLKGINWKRSACEWKCRVMRNDGRIINNESAIMYATNYIKKCLGIELTEDEQSLEDKLQNERGLI